MARSQNGKADEMKKLMSVLAAVLCTAFLLLGAPIKDVSFVWLPNPPEDDVQSYHIYEVVGTNYVRMATVPGTETRATLVGLEWSQARTFVCAAENWIGESPYSESVTVSGRPGKPLNFERN